MEENKTLKVIYTIFLGLLLSIFIGVGVNTFYPAPESPVYPVVGEYKEGQEPAELVEYNQASEKYSADTDVYNRNVSIITLVASVILIAFSVFYKKQLTVVAEGVMFGGLFTLVYSIIRGFSANDDRYLFLAIAIGLAVIIYLGYSKFAKSVTGKK